MKSLTIYDIATGEVKKTIFVPSHHVVDLAAGEGILEGQYDDDKFIVVNGSPVERPIIQFSDHYSEPKPVTEVDVRRARNAILAQSDWTQLADTPVDQSAWAAYRQSLRDIPAQEGFPSQVIWPTSPEMPNKINERDTD